jgi:hypothetical protein
MWTETDQGRELIADVSKRIVSQVAPEELDLFDELMEEYFEDPTPPDLSDSDDDEALGFGLGEALVAATPAAAAVVSGVVGYILKEVLKTVQKESASALTKRIGKFFNPQEKNTGLTKEQMKQVRQKVVKQAKAFGMEGDQVRRMADAVIGSLALAA